MSTNNSYDLYCHKHGHLHIEVEKPPGMFSVGPFCPFCLSKLMEPNKDKDKEERLQPNFVSEGARA